ncbi:ankyrin repeat-containing domain protein [Hypoxylon cercidicola]|nr:ankyrin repeat-containing domain protein [Hypoxylon cercidicola]
MVGLLDLPPELFRPIIQDVIGYYWYIGTPWSTKKSKIVSRVKLHEAVSLRLVNKVFDLEVMWDITSRRLLNPEVWHMPRWCRICRLHWHQDSSWTWKDSSWFEARYLLTQPRSRGAWNENITSLLNHLVDEVGRQECRVLPESDRYRYLHDLCQALWPRDANWRAGRHHGMLPWLYPAFSPITSQPIEFLVAAAQIILGMNGPVLRFLDSCGRDTLAAQDEVFGTLLQVAIRARRHEVVRRILDRGVDVNHECHRALETAIDDVGNDYSIAEIILEPAYGYSVHDLRFEKCVVKSIEARQTRMANFLLDKAGGDRLNYVAHDGLRHACCNGDIALVRSLLDRYPDIDINSTSFWQSRQTSVAPLTLAIKSGNRELLQLLLEKGANPWGDPTFSTAVTGNNLQITSMTGSKGMVPLISAIERNDTEIIRMLLEAKLQLPPQQWSHAIIKANAMGHDEVIEFLVNAEVIHFRGCDPKYSRLVPGMVRAFCQTANIAAIKLFASRGVPLHGTTYEGGPTPMEIAMRNGFRDVAAALTECGVVPGVDIQSILQKERVGLAVS